ncbi:MULTISPECIES: SLAP domain-containing protein [unclassified Lactobacillus]|uniref:SLAP domain-containing protein n=1 Tax=unclassified Lactobacillus TaxID=2620435 RepID=UPI000EFD693E|nr:MULTISPECIES: SLAP domain-containing protein [unclassified Lactobacillus]RMC24216.1 hypothetical protein F5ESL0247_05650 [Lactobacillus sp. ESL0247]RMC28789.1 hypothetical protein F5ESL0246_05650 [Lactobacillus sp. ESL0246]RMC31446.1 hypothetical protein F5ESL0245_05655 [Lactobacillus sp. ESL0245]
MVSKKTIFSSIILAAMALMSTNVKIVNADSLQNNQESKMAVSDQAPFVGPDVVVYYQDEQGNDIVPRDVIEGTANNGYITNAKEIPGYTMISRPANATGIFGAVPQRVVYVYRSNDSHLVSMTLMHNAYIYDLNHQRIGKEMLPAFTKVNVYSPLVRLTDGSLAYQTDTNSYIMAGNVFGTLRTVKNDTYVYETSSKKTSKRIVPAGKQILTFGSRYRFYDCNGYYRVGGPKKQYIRVDNFVKEVK